MTQTLKLAIAGLMLCVAATGAKAAPMDPTSPNAPTPDYDFGTLVAGVNSITGFQPDREPNVSWFQFILNIDSPVEIDTFGSAFDTWIGLYDDSGQLYGDNDDCPIGGTLLSCLNFDLPADTYFVGVSQFGTNPITQFLPDFEVIRPGLDDERIVLNVSASALSAVPVPAAVWLFGSAMIGLVGMARKRSARAQG